MERVSYEEFQMWQAYYLIEPFGELRHDFRLGQVCATMANIVSDKKVTYNATDFIPTTDSIEAEKAKQTVYDMNEKLDAGFKALKAAATGGKSAKRLNK